MYSSDCCRKPASDQRLPAVHLNSNRWPCPVIASGRGSDAKDPSMAAKDGPSADPLLPTRSKSIGSRGLLLNPVGEDEADDDGSASWETAPQPKIKELQEELRRQGAPCLSGFSIQVCLRGPWLDRGLDGCQLMIPHPIPITSYGCPTPYDAKGAFDSSRRNYSSIWRDMEQRMKMSKTLKADERRAPVHAPHCTAPHCTVGPLSQSSQDLVHHPPSTNHQPPSTVPRI